MDRRGVLEAFGHTFYRAVNMHINAIDHIVLTVKNIDKSVAFYTSVLGMQMRVFGEKRVALFFGKQKINLHKATEELLPHAKHPTSGSADICLITDTPLEEAMQEVSKHAVAIEEGPVQRSGAQGDIISFYIRDTDGNLIEIANKI